MSNRDKIMKDYWKDFDVEESARKSQRQIELDEKKEKIQKKIEDLKALRGDVRIILNFPTIMNSINANIDSLDEELDKLQRQEILQEKVGKYFCYADGVYIFIKDINGPYQVCDEFYTTIGGGGINGMRVHKNVNESLDINKIREEISKEEFFRLFKEACKKVIKNGFGEIK